MDASAMIGCWYLPGNKRRKNTPKIGFCCQASSMVELKTMTSLRQ
jgi:hypothetical protein